MQNATNFSNKPRTCVAHSPSQPAGDKLISSIGQSRAPIKPIRNIMPINFEAALHTANWNELD